MNKKGQAAMEFVMTYGISIFVILVIIGALAYLLVFSPENFRTDYCSCRYKNMSYSNTITEKGLTYIECANTIEYLNPEKTRIEQQNIYSIFICAENKTLISLS